MSTSAYYRVADPVATVLAVDRALAELRRGCSVQVDTAEGPVWIAAVETLSHRVLPSLAQPQLLLSGARGRVLGLTSHSQPLLIQPPAEADLGWYRALAYQLRLAPTTHPTLSAQRYSSPLLERLLLLAKHGHLLPALVLTQQAPLTDSSVRVAEAQIEPYPLALAQSLHIEAEARVPLALTSAEFTRFVLFRAADGASEHVAVIVGQLDVQAPVLVRLHSACFTGDLFASLKCDCGEQLRSTVNRMARAGGGILLYLNQEGRGIGLANKLRAYGLQADGYDTLDADALLGFGPDERRFELAAEMLKQLGVQQVRLLTNNPSKVAALQAAGLQIAERLAVLGSVNPHNEGYLMTKANRAGHLFDPKLSSFQRAGSVCHAAAGRESN